MTMLSSCAEPLQLPREAYRHDWASRCLARIFGHQGWDVVREDEINAVDYFNLQGDDAEDLKSLQLRERVPGRSIRQPSGLLITKRGPGRDLRLWIKPHIKDRISQHRNRGQDEAGFPFDLLDIYDQIALLTGTEVYCLFFIQKENLVLGFCDAARRAGGRFDYGNKMEPNGMAFFRVGILRKIGRETEIRSGDIDSSLVDEVFFESHEGWAGRMAQAAGVRD